MNHRHRGIAHGGPGRKYRCTNLLLTQAVSRGDGSLSVSDVCLPLGGNAEQVPDGANSPAK